AGRRSGQPVPDEDFDCWTVIFLRVAARMRTAHHWLFTCPLLIQNWRRESESVALSVEIILKMPIFPAYASKHFTYKCKHFLTLLLTFLLTVSCVFKSKNNRYAELGIRVIFCSARLCRVAGAVPQNIEGSPLFFVPQLGIIRALEVRN